MSANIIKVDFHNKRRIAPDDEPDVSLLAKFEHAADLVSVLGEKGLGDVFDRAVRVTQGGAIYLGDNIAGEVDNGTYVVEMTNGLVVMEKTVEAAVKSISESVGPRP